MKKNFIPQFTLPEIAIWNGLPKTELPDYNLSSVEPGCLLQEFPYRTTFYGIGMCKTGTVKLHARLDCYSVTPGSILIMEPELVRSWSNQSADYLNNAIFFTEAFLTEESLHFKLLQNFHFLKSEAPKVWQLASSEFDRIWHFLREIKYIVLSDSIRKKEIVRGYLMIVLNIVADNFDLYNTSQTEPTTWINDLVDRFKSTVTEHYMTRRLVSDYADLLNVTSKHLSESVKMATGRTAGRWIDGLLILEAKVLLKQTKLNISQIALHTRFNDVSSFGKFFKRHTGISPIAYRKLTYLE